MNTLTDTVKKYLQDITEYAIKAQTIEESLELEENMESHISAGDILNFDDPAKTIGSVLMHVIDNGLVEEGKMSAGPVQFNIHVEEKSNRLVIVGQRFYNKNLTDEEKELGVDGIKELRKDNKNE